MRLDPDSSLATDAKPPHHFSRVGPWRGGGRTGLARHARGRPAADAAVRSGQERRNNRDAGRWLKHVA